MSNTSFSKIGELMMPGRTADPRSAKPASGDDASSGAAGERFEQLLQTASRQRRNAQEQPGARRADDRQKPLARADRQRPTTERFDTPDRADRAEIVQRDEPGPRDVDGDRDRPDNDDRPASDDRRGPDDRADRDSSDDRTGSDDDRSSDRAADGSDPESDGTSQSTSSVEEGDTDPAMAIDDEASATTSDAATELLLDAPASEAVGKEGSGEPVLVEPAVTVSNEAEQGEAAEIVAPADSAAVDDQPAAEDGEAIESELVDEVETAVIDEQDVTAATNNAAAAVAATTPVATETDALGETPAGDVDGELVTEAGLATTEITSGIDGDGEVVVQLPDDGAAETESADGPETTSPEGAEAEADQSSPDGETQQEEPQTDDADAEFAPVVAPAQASTIQGSAQATTNPIAGLADVSATGELASSSAGRVASTAPSEQADGADPLWRQVRRAMGSIRNLPTGEQQLTIRLRPNDLGSVTVRISTGEAGTTVALVADSAAAASQLNQQRQQLIRELEDGGLRGVAVDVGTSGDTEQSNGDPEAESEQGARIADGAAGTNAENGPVRAYSGRRDGRVTEGLIDVDL